MNGTDLIKVLETVTQDNMTNGSLGSLWEELPDFISGSDWVGEVVDCAERMIDYLNAGEEYAEDYLQDYAGEFANGECEDYYNTINKRVQALSLWAYDELDAEVQVLNEGRDYPTMTDLNAQYLCAAMFGLWHTVARWATYEASQLEEAEA